MARIGMTTARPIKNGSEPITRAPATNQPQRHQGIAQRSFDRGDDGHGHPVRSSSSGNDQAQRERQHSKQEANRVAGYDQSLAAGMRHPAHELAESNR
jgi:hypothetical protein